ncbi:YicC family protein [Flavobacteriaceae bacterium]|nr:YicC family protein [Flavobacteriaceae bacterium]
MIQSMTGYGKAEKQFDNKNISVELRSLNSKSLDLNTRLPYHLKEIENQLKKTIGEALVRGKVDLSLHIENTNLSNAKTINVNTVNQYIDQLSQIHEGDRFELLKVAMRLPDVLRTDLEDLNDLEVVAIKDLLNVALEHLDSHRLDEGKTLEIEFLKRLEALSNLLTEAEKIDPERTQKVSEKLKDNLNELKVEIDQNRFEQELIYYLEKYDITEEKVRLKTHIDYFKETLDASVSSGKKLGFIAQEMGREINTIGSKANHAALQKVVVQMKDELEKIKEQLLNVL